MMKNVCIAGATGWAGSALTRAVHEQKDMQVVVGTSGLTDADYARIHSPAFEEAWIG